ncbi:hypothetical protein CFBP3846_P200116 (plasmid) [Pseudomonas syringae pv. avii]|uniref:Secreted protein n=1 Tax=Pseudomonas syringae pv. avii TaxID=663959 RepID=A0ABY1UFH9_PSESX|nr:hypothetical protein CFBP3846_P200116 [Pseudomonas syringae pv. avii]
MRSLSAPTRSEAPWRIETAANLRYTEPSYQVSIIYLWYLPNPTNARPPPRLNHRIRWL